MTATRWWVRAGARWLARIDGVSGQLRLAMLGMTGLSTATLTLRQYGHGEYAWPLISVTLVLGLVFAWLYTEGGVWNQMARDRQDMSNNFANPNARIVTEMNGRVFVAGMQGEELSDDQIEAMKAEADRVFEEFSDGVDLDGYDR